MSDDKRYVIVTGGNRGIGYATALELARRGAHVIITARDVKRGDESANAIRAACPNASVEVMALDLASLASVRKFAEAYRARGYPLHALINNAGAVGLTGPIQFTQDGFEMEFGINHLGHFLLTELLLPVLHASAPARVIAVSSIRHIPGKGGKGAQFDFDNLKGEKWYEPRMFYNNTKLANVWFAYELDRRERQNGITSIAACPGFVPQTLGSTKKGIAGFFYNRVLMLIPAARTAEVSGRELADLALDSEHANDGGKFFAGGKAIPSSTESYDADKARRLWELSEQLTYAA
jgi:NAD(P)-dependent dehydrogenase (short-subunit alcohol dehydrogenase family)